MNILLLDDDAFLRDMYVTKFTESGHTVESVPEPSSALTALKERTFDVVLLDMIMPGMTGIEFLKTVQKDQLAASTVFIVLSNQSEEKDISDAMAHGATGYIVKAECVPSDVVHKVEEFYKHNASTQR